ncbi:MAG: hypothetical protein E7325_07290 [Clostridiales bacterium]|nr:hypothetical protein [Clostridiales bacterium]
MGAYMYTTKTITKRINYFYRCSKCGSICGQSAFISGSANFSKYGGEAAENNASNKANTLSDKAVMNALDRAHNGDYRAMHIKSKCPKCKYREPWQRMGISFIVYCVVVFLFIGICLVAMGANNKNVIQIIIGGVVIALPFAVLLGGIVRRRKMNDLSLQLPETSRPHFFMPGDKEAAAKALLQCGFHEGEQVIDDYKDFPKRR